MTVLHRQRNSFQEPVSMECSHGRSGTIRGVVSGTETGTSNALPVGQWRTPMGFWKSRQTSNCRCGVPEYLMSLDESLMDYALKNFITCLDRELKKERAETRIVSALTRRADFHSGLR